MEAPEEKDPTPPPPPNKWTDTTAYVRWLLEWHWRGSPKAEKVKRNEEKGKSEQ